MNILCNYAKTISDFMLKNSNRGNLAKYLAEKEGISSTQAKVVADRFSKQYLKALSELNSYEDIKRFANNLIKTKDTRKTKKYEEMFINVISGKGNINTIKKAIIEDKNLPSLSKFHEDAIVKSVKNIQAIKKKMPPAQESSLELERAMSHLESRMAEALPKSFLSQSNLMTTFNLLSNVSTTSIGLTSNIAEGVMYDIRRISSLSARGQYTYLSPKLMEDINRKTWDESWDAIKENRTMLSFFDKAKDGKQSLSENIFVNQFDSEHALKNFSKDELTKIANTGNLAKTIYHTFGSFAEVGLRSILSVSDNMTRESIAVKSILQQLGENIAKGHVKISDPARLEKFTTADEVMKLFNDLDSGKLKIIGTTDNSPTWDDIRSIARYHSDRTTFQDNSVLAQVSSKLIKIAEEQNPLIQGSFAFVAGANMKFVKIPSNVGLRLLERNLFSGSILTVSRWASAKHFNEFSAYYRDTRALDNLSEVLFMAGATTGVSLAGMALVNFGVLKEIGISSEDGEVGWKDKFTFKNGKVLIGNKYELDPSKLLALFASGTDLTKLGSYDWSGDNFARNVIEFALKDGERSGDAFWNMPSIGGLKDTTDDFKKAEKSWTGAMQTFAKMGLRGLSQWIPMSGLSRQMNRTFESVQRQTSDPDAVKTWLNRMLESLPGGSQGIEPFINRWGGVVRPPSISNIWNDVEAGKGDVTAQVIAVVGALTVFYSRQIPSEEEAELERLSGDGGLGYGFGYPVKKINISTKTKIMGEVKSSTKAVNLTYEERSKWAKHDADKLRKALKRLTTNPEYKRLSDEDKVIAIKNLYKPFNASKNNAIKRQVVARLDKKK